MNKEVTDKLINEFYNAYDVIFAPIRNNRAHIKLLLLKYRIVSINGRWSQVDPVFFPWPPKGEVVVKLKNGDSFIFHTDSNKEDTMKLLADKVLAQGKPRRLFVTERKGKES